MSATHWHKPGATRWAACNRRGTTTTRKESVTCMVCRKKAGLSTAISLERILEVTNHVNEGERGSVTRRELFETVRYWSNYGSALAGMAAEIAALTKVRPALATLHFFQGSFPAGRGRRLLMEHEDIERGDQRLVDDKWKPITPEMIGTKTEKHQWLIRRKVKLV